MLNFYEQYQINKILEEAVKRVTDGLINDYSSDFKEDEDIHGLEAEMTGSLRSAFNQSLLRELKDNLHDNIIGRYQFDVKTFKPKKEEPHIGADLLGRIHINFNGQNVYKYFLAQSKIGKSITKDVSFGDGKMISQAQKMLAITSDSFFLIYHKSGIKVISAFMVLLQNKPTIRISNIGGKEISSFISDFFNCFVGDHLNNFFHYSPKTTSDFTNYILDIKITLKE